MSGWSRMRAALRNLAHRQRAESDLDAEVRACAEMLADEKMAGGIPAAEARRRCTGGVGRRGTGKAGGARRAGGNRRRGIVAGHAVWTAATAPFAGLRCHWAADHRDGTWCDDGNVQHRRMP